METIISELQFIGQRFNSASVLDILLVAGVVFIVLKMMNMSHISALLRGIMVVVAVVFLLSLFDGLTAFNFLVSNAIPAMIIMIPIIFAPEIRKLFERLGRFRSVQSVFSNVPVASESMFNSIDVITKAVDSLSSHKTGALIVMEYFDRLDKYVESGVIVDAAMKAEMLMQIFYPNTPLHDGAVIIRNGRIYAASCVMPLTSQNFMDRTPEKHMGLRHRAALGISEEADCPVIIVSEETGTISLAMNGEITRNITPAYLKTKLENLYHTPEQIGFGQAMRNIIQGWRQDLGIQREEKKK